MDPVRLDQHVDPQALARDLAPWLDDLEARIDPVDEDRLLAAWKTFADGAWSEPLFRPRRLQPAAPRIDWPVIGIDQAIEDPRSMLLRQFAACSGVLARGDGMLLCVRADYGTGILPSLFGVPVVKMARALDTLPGTRPLGTAAMAAMVAAGIPPLGNGLWPLVRTVGQSFVACLTGRPKLARHVHIYHPDLQGPMDVLEMAWGSECFTGFVEEPELTHALLRVITDTYQAVLADWDAVVPDHDPGWCAHWGLLHRGHIMLRDDSAMNLSPRMFRDLCAPYDGALLERCGGGAIHACGRVGHFLAQATALRGMAGFNFGQPEMNDPRVIERETIARRVPIVGLSEQRWRELEAAGVEPRGLVQVG
jgi:hypothetical protein